MQKNYLLLVKKFQNTSSALPLWPLTFSKQKPDDQWAKVVDREADKDAHVATNLGQHGAHLQGGAGSQDVSDRH